MKNCEGVILEQNIGIVLRTTKNLSNKKLRKSDDGTLGAMGRIV
jgi:hypothetical protein